MKSLGIAVSLVAATPALAVEMPVRLKDGATWTITAEHTRTQAEGDQEQTWSLTTVKQLTWQAPNSGEPGRLLVTPVSATPGEGSPAEVAAGRSLAIPALIQVDESLAPEAIVNTDEVRAAFAAVLGADIKGREAQADASAMAMIASEVSFASRSQGMDLSLQEPASYEDAAPNPLGGPPIQSLGVYTLESHDAAAGRAVVVWRQELDPASMRASLAEGLVQAIKSNPAKRAEAEAAFAKMDIAREDVCTHEIDLASGLATKAGCTLVNKVTAGDRQMVSIDRWIITQTLPETN